MYDYVLKHSFSEHKIISLIIDFTMQKGRLNQAAID
jgi:hypothetical protein